MNTRKDIPTDHDENPPLDADFFDEARPAFENTALMQVLLKDPSALENALRQIVEAHDAGDPLEGPISKARAIPHAAE
ncbi:hypothetical protein [Pseudaestuariivita sp.]|uniref:hypothetical protein n=1 Tax=Pseudaestuariivita sp. TaxID=2211669 RepID=UPI0040583B94